MGKIEGHTLLFVITPTYFALSFFHIILALSALVCMGPPFYLAYRDQKKTWCRSICPRADFLQKIGRISRRKSAPKWMVGNKARRAVLGYFCMNFLFVTMSTIAVATGRVEPIEKIRLLIVLELPWNLPQLISVHALPAWVSHLSYRFYSIILTSTLIGVGLALRYKPRTWCAVCPVSTMTGNMIRNLERTGRSSEINSRAS
ncbi:MAG: 4Fe-4S binding protein [Spirochaetaceae bacterium]|nr:4Fe-4S binding protein [Spirochaetaceae bacterium]